MANSYFGNGEVKLTVACFNSGASPVWITTAPEKPVNYKPTHVIFNGDATIVFFEDETKIVVRRMEGDPEDRHHAVSAAIAEKVMGSKNQVSKLVRNAHVELTKEQREEQKQLKKNKTDE